jgi:enoyl-CoA hydratase/carnithine racemase
MVLTGRAMDASEALAHGIVSRVVPRDDLESTVRDRGTSREYPAATVKMARRAIRHLSEPEIRRSMSEELMAQTFINKSDDYAEFRAAKAEERTPRYTGS